MKRSDVLYVIEKVNQSVEDGVKQIVDPFNKHYVSYKEGETYACYVGAIWLNSDQQSFEIERMFHHKEKGYFDDTIRRWSDEGMDWELIHSFLYDMIDEEE